MNNKELFHVIENPITQLHLYSINIQLYTITIKNIHMVFLHAKISISQTLEKSIEFRTR